MSLDYLRALKNGDSSEIKVLYKKTFPLVRKFVLQNKGNVTDADDVFQKALLQITVRYQKEPFIIKSSFEAYLFTVCKNLWRRELNKRKKEVTYEDALEHKSIDMALTVLDQKRWELFTEILEGISENCKQILKLYFNKRPYEEIRDIMGYASETVARQRVFRCKTMLKNTIREDKRYDQLKEL